MSAPPTSASAPRALLIDFGGVLTSDLLASFRAWGRAHGGDERLVEDALAHDADAARLLVELEKGLIGDAAFERGFAARLAVRAGADAAIEPAGLLRALTRGLRPDERMLALLARVRAAGVPTAIVSNAFGSDCYAGFELDALADAVVLSSALGVRKPSREIYRVACARLDVAPRDCVLVDDLALNLAGAARLGIAGIEHRSADVTVPAVERAFGLAPGLTSGRC